MANDLWPEVIAALGPRRGGHPFAACLGCPAPPTWTFVRYGEAPICRSCALRLAAGRDLPFVHQALERVRRALEAREGRGNGRPPTAAGEAHPLTPAAAVSNPEIATAPGPKGTAERRRMRAATDGPSAGQGRLISQPQPRLPWGPEVPTPRR